MEGGRGGGGGRVLVATTEMDERRVLTFCPRLQIEKSPHHEIGHSSFACKVWIDIQTCSVSNMTGLEENGDGSAFITG